MEFALEEGSVNIWANACCDDDSGCKIAEEGLGDYIEWVEMPPVSVSVKMATDCPAYDVDNNCVPLGKPKPFSYFNGSHSGTHGKFCDCN